MRIARERRNTRYGDDTETATEMAKRGLWDVSDVSVGVRRPRVLFSRLYLACTFPCHDSKKGQEEPGLEEGDSHGVWLA